MNRWLIELLPVLSWIRAYQLNDFRSDLIAGIVVLFITIPQVIAYAFLAGLPAEMGLYAALAALAGYALFGSSRSLAVGPTAIIAMMTLEVVSASAESGSLAYSQLAIKLALVTGLILIVLRLVNFGAVISFLSHAVVTGFITAAACLIMVNQIPVLLGLNSPPSTAVYDVLLYVFGAIPAVNYAALMMSLGAIILLWFCRDMLDVLLARLGLGEQLRGAIVKSAPMYAVAIATVVTWLLSLNVESNLQIVSDIPAQLPELSLMQISLAEIGELLPSGLLIAMVVFMESTSIGTAVASKKRQKINANQELVGLGVANISASLAGGFPVAGSFARSIVNFSAGAVTQIAAIITALLVVITLFGFTSLFYFLPKAVLSAIIVMSASQLIDFSSIRKIFQFNLTDAVTFSITFIAVLLTGVESGILIGIVISFVLLIRSSSRPHIAIVGRVGDSEHFRNVLRYDVSTHPELLALRIDESFYFVNSRFIERFILEKLADSPQIKHVLLICSGVNFIDTSGLEMMEELDARLEEMGAIMHLAEVKSPIMDRIRETAFHESMRGQVFFTTDIAFRELVSA